MEWPEGLTIRPIHDWPGVMTPDTRRQYAPFRATWTSTMMLLRKELRALDAKQVVLQVALREGDFRLDGRPRANAKQEHPGVILALESKHGALSYPADLYTSWQDNVRAIALSLESLRRVDRYGVTKRGEQYRGWRAIESSPSVVDPETVVIVTAFGTVTEYGLEMWRLNRRDVISKAQRRAHPDSGGTTESWNALSAALQELGDA